MKKVLAIGLLLFSPSLLLAQNTGATRVSSVNTSTQGGGASGATVVGTTSVCSVGSSGEANSVCLNSSGQIVFEGATADTIELIVDTVDPTVSDRTFSFPNLSANGEFVITSGTQTVGGAKTFSNLIISTANLTAANDVGYSIGTNAATSGLLLHETATTPDRTSFYTGTTSNSIGIAERGDLAFDFNNGPCGTSACTDPTLIGHSANQSTTEWWSLTHDQTNAVLDWGSGVLDLTGGAGGVLSLKAVEAVTTTKTPTTGESGECYTNTGDTDGVAFTLPNDPTVGTTYCFVVTASVGGGEFGIAPNTGETLQYGSDACAVDITATAVGASITLMAATGGSGAIWVTTSHAVAADWTCNDA